MAFDARWPFRCGSCGELHPKGTPAQYDQSPSTISAVYCGENADRTISEPLTSANRDQPTMPRGRSVSDACERCFQIPSANGTCGCNE